MYTQSLSTIKANSQRDNYKGLTLIELLVTIAVLSIVAAIAVPIVNNVVNSSDERASAQTQSDIRAFVDKYNTSGGYTYDPTASTFEGYVDLDGDGSASVDEKIEELPVDSTRFAIVSSPADAPSELAEIDFDSSPDAVFSIVGYAGSISPESITISGYAGEAIEPTAVNIENFQEPYSWTISSGTLPSGLSLNTLTGTVTGMPTAATTSEVEIAITDSNGVTATQSHIYNFSEAPSVEPSSITVDSEVNNPIEDTVVIPTGFTEPYSWSLTSGSIPDGLILDASTGVVSGPPTSTGSFNATITISDANGRTASQSQAYNITSPAPLVVMSDSSPGPNENTGGWNTSYSAGTRGPIISVTDDYMALRGPYWTDGNADTVNTFDLTEVSSITIEVSASGVRSSYFYSSFWWKGSDGGWDTYSFGNPSNANFGRTTFTIPITDGGVGSLRLRVTNSDGGYVYLHSVTLNY